MYATVPRQHNDESRDTHCRVARQSGKQTSPTFTVICNTINAYSARDGEDIAIVTASRVLATRSYNVANMGPEFSKKQLVEESTGIFDLSAFVFTDTQHLHCLA